MKFLRSLLFVLPALGFFMWSYILTDPQLIYSRLIVFVRFQEFLWQFKDNHVLITVIYLGLLAAFWGMYWFVLKTVRNISLGSMKKYLLPGAIIVLLLILSNPALSYDLFNYMFDAKLVIQYHLDPHTTSAISFSESDLWVRFMRNVFFPTTYGYVWTALSLVPFILGIGKLLTVFVAFKLYALLSLGLLFVVQKQILVRTQIKVATHTWRLALFFTLPLVLFESLSSAHNDIWMMLFAFVSFLLLLPKNRQLSGKLVLRIIASLILLILSSQIKRATGLLLPVWLLLVVGLFLPHHRLYLLLKDWWADLGALLMFLPLLTPLSRQFHPWYLLWSLSFLPFIRSKFLRTILIVFSFTSLLRYLPILYTGEYSIAIEALQRTITWSAVPLGLIIYYLFWVISRRRKL